MNCKTWILFAGLIISPAACDNKNKAGAGGAGSGQSEASQQKTDKQLAQQFLALQEALEGDTAYRIEGRQ
jgi:hypothetical protein